MCFWVSVLVLSGLQRFPIFPLLLLLCSFFPPFISGLSSPASLRWITMVTGSPLFSCLTATRSPDNRITQEAPCRTSRAPSRAPKHKMFLTAAANCSLFLSSFTELRMSVCLVRPGRFKWSCLVWQLGSFDSIGFVWESGSVCLVHLVHLVHIVWFTSSCCSGI